MKIQTFKSERILVDAQSYYKLRFVYNTSIGRFASFERMYKAFNGKNIILSTSYSTNGAYTRNPDFGFGYPSCCVFSLLQPRHRSIPTSTASLSRRNGNESGYMSALLLDVFAHMS
jgi:hypothetical protein